MEKVSSFNPTLIKNATTEMKNACSHKLIRFFILNFFSTLTNHVISAKQFTAITHNILMTELANQSGESG
jgi:hypothetical protein